MLKKWILPFLLLLLLLTGCGNRGEKPFQYTDYTLFDTVTTIVGYGESQEKFEQQAKKICDDLRVYHRLFDIYNDYEGLHNLKTVNDQAGLAPVQVEQPILDLLTDCRNYWVLTDEKVNVAMGSLLSLWHQAREQVLADPAHGTVPSADARIFAQKHSAFQNIEIDREAKTVYLRDPDVKLDVGAVAKGWAAQRVSSQAPSGMLISVGGNVCATGPKPDGSPWVVGIQNPDGQGYLRTVELSEGSIVTSGDYQRYFEMDGKRYHHIIDPDSTWPSQYWRSVTVICPDSGLADALSTALFLLPRDRGQELLTEVDAEAMWLDREGNLFYSQNFPRK